MPSARFGEVKLKKVKVKVATQATDCRTDGYGADALNEARSEVKHQKSVTNGA